MPLILFECALHRFRHRPPNWTLMIKVVFKFISALRPWLACTIFSAMIPLRLRTPSLKNYSLIFLHAFTLIFSIILLTNTPRMKNQFIQLFLHSILMIRPTFPKKFLSYLLCFLSNSKIFYHKDGTRHTKGPPAENDRRPGRGPEVLTYPKPTRVREHLQLLPPFLGSPGRKQSEPLPTVKTC